MELFREILKVNKKYNLIENNDTIVVGFSGGPDSVFLVEMLKKLQNFINFKIYLVHINHLLRGKDAVSDENFSFEYAKKNSSLLTKFLNAEKLMFATNSANLPTSWLQTS